MLLTVLERSDRALSFFGIFKYLGLVALVIVLAYLTTRLVSKGYMRGLKSRELELIDKLILSPDKSLALVRLKAEHKVYLISLDKTGVNLIDKLEDTNLGKMEVPSSSPLEATRFKDFLNKFGGDKK